MDLMKVLFKEKLNKAKEREKITQYLHAKIFKDLFSTVQLNTCSIISQLKNAFSTFENKKMEVRSARILSNAQSSILLHD